MAVDTAQLEREADSLLVEALGGEAPKQDQATPEAGHTEQQPAPESTPPAEEASGTVAQTADAPATPADTAQPAESTQADPAPSIEEETVPISRYKNAERMMHQRAQEAADLRKRVAHLEALLQQAEAQRQQASTGATAQPPDDDDAELAEFAEFYPETKPLVEKIKRLEKALASREGGAEQSDTTSSQTAESSGEDPAMAAHWGAILAAHSDAEQIAQDNKFWQWVGQQPEDVQSVMSSGTAAQVNTVLSFYKQAGRQQPSPAGDTLERARSVATPRPQHIAGQKPNQRVFTRAEINAMSSAEFARHEAEIDRQLAQGLIA